ncbi:MAG: hypothetical protein OXR72_12515 [Gemmatimonadota bacterium]|nr:hypothetical protein [Gemmatimonadota bacterium]
MSSRWLGIQSFHHSQDLLSAINTVSIHRKLTAGGHPDTIRIEAAEHAQETLIAFFDRLEHVARIIEDGHREPVLGADLRLLRLAENYVNTKHAHSQSHPIFELSLSQVNGMFYSRRPQDCQNLLEILAVFRILIEEHVCVNAWGTRKEFS